MRALDELGPDGRAQLELLSELKKYFLPVFSLMRWNISQRCFETLITITKMERLSRETQNPGGMRVIRVNLR